MMTYLPLANLTDSVRALHRNDLREQVLDAGHSLRHCVEEKDSPIVSMWRGYEGGLWAYFLACCRELRIRGVSDTVLVQSGLRVVNAAGYDTQPPRFPQWFGWRPLHDSHASTLIRHRPEHYARLWPTVPLDMPVLWPRAHSQTGFSVRITAEQRRQILTGDLVLPLAHDYLGRLES